MIIDNSAKRRRVVGNFALGSLKDIKDITRLIEHNKDFTDNKNILQTLLENYESIICFLRKDIFISDYKHRDPGTADFMTGLLEQHEKMSWMLRAHLL